MTVWTLLLEAVRTALFALTHVLGGSLGFGIIALSLLTRAALLPWGIRAARRGIATRAALKALKPRLERIKKLHGTNPSKLREALLAEYRRAGISPFSGSAVALISVQLPLGWALYTVIRDGVTGSNPFLWVANLARPDIALSIAAGALSVGMALSTPMGSESGSQIAFAAIMGISAFLVVFHLSAGVALYWASSSAMGIVQNVLVRRSLATQE